MRFRNVSPRVQKSSPCFVLCQLNYIKYLLLVEFCHAGSSFPKLSGLIRQLLFKMRILCVILMLLVSSLNCYAVNTDEITKKFIQLVIETHNGCISSELSKAIPRGEQIRARLGLSPEAFLVPDIVLWEPLSYFHSLSLICPSCLEIGVNELLRPIRWKDGRTINDQPRFLYGLSNNVLLVSRIYLCKNKHQILSHDDRILSQIDDQFLPTSFPGLFPFCHWEGGKRPWHRAVFYVF